MKTFVHAALGYEILNMFIFYQFIYFLYLLLFLHSRSVHAQLQSSFNFLFRFPILFYLFVNYHFTSIQTQKFQYSLNNDEFSDRMCTLSTSFHNEILTSAILSSSFHSYVLYLKCNGDVIDKLEKLQNRV